MNRNATTTRPYRTRASAKAQATSLGEDSMDVSAMDLDGVSVDAFEPSRRDSLNAFALLATTVAANITLPVSPAFAGDPTKVVTVPYLKYEVTTESTAESIEVAKSLKAAGARLYGAFWCENCNKQKEVLGKEAMEYIDYVECFPNGVYQNAPDGRADVTKPDQICDGYTSAWPLWVVPKDGGDPGEEIGIQGQIKKPKELQRLVKEAKGDTFDPVAYFTSGGDGYTKGEEVEAK
ncbi:hypothetical protein N9L76_09070 [bacterium]|jgi:hypothetical protein|nr:hypothetical protein [bacterium]|tara:strand:+ start:2823 stop:3527 length:705 start_codon:yes stop_codon:yes gene_type:complete